MAAKRTVRAKRVRLKDRRRVRSYLVASAYALLLLGVLGGIAYGTRRPEVTVTRVSVEGAVHVKADALTTQVESVLDGTYALLVPKRMSYLVPKGAIVASVLEAFPPIQSAEVTRPDRQSVAVTVVEREPAALWCAPEPDGRCYKMDAYGYIFDKGPNETGYRTYHGLVSSPIGSTYLEGGFQDFEAFLSHVEAATGRRIMDVALDEVDVVLTFHGGGELRFTRERDRDDVLADITSVFTSPDFKSHAGFEYVELRFGTKAVVKFAPEP